MKKRTYKMFVEDILSAMDKISRYIKGFTFEMFEKDEMIIDAIVRNLEIIGEASRNIPEEVREKYPYIPWRRMIGLRNIVIHEYFGIDLDIIWQIISINLPETRSEVKYMLMDFQREKEL